MDEQLLRRFQTDANLRNEVIAFIGNFIEQEAVNRVFKREDVSSVADAKELIDLAFNELENLYGIKKETPQRKNQSR